MNKIYNQDRSFMVDLDQVNSYRFDNQPYFPNYLFLIINGVERRFHGEEAVQLFEALKPKV